MAGEMVQGLPGFATSRSPQHQEQGRHWSGQKVSPHRVRLGCKHDYAEPGQPHRLLTEPGIGQCVTCEPCYLTATA